MSQKNDTRTQCATYLRAPQLCLLSCHGNGGLRVTQQGSQRTSFQGPANVLTGHTPNGFPVPRNQHAVHTSGDVHTHHLGGTHSGAHRKGLHKLARGGCSMNTCPLLPSLPQSNESTSF